MTEKFERMKKQALRIECPHCSSPPQEACRVEVPYRVGWGPFSRERWHYVDTTPHTTRIGQSILRFGPVA